MEKAGMSRHVQRIAPPFGEEPAMNLWMYSVCWPGLWEKMINRVPGAATAARYARTELYGYGKLDKPEAVTWKEMIERFLQRHPVETRGHIAHRLKLLIEQHYRKTDEKLPEDKDHPISGLSWKRLASIASRGDKGGSDTRSRRNRFIRWICPLLSQTRMDKDVGHFHHKGYS